MKNLRKVQAQLAKEMDLIVKELHLAVRMEEIKTELKLAVEMERIKAELKLAKQMQDKVELAIENMHKELAKL